MKHKNFACFILSHGRAKNIKTISALKKCGYTGKYYIIIDNEDDQEEEYRKKYQDKIIQFDKIKASEYTDTLSPSKKRNAVVFARNECHKIAKKLGLEYFLELDDDYNDFNMRYFEDGILKSISISRLDDVFDIYLDFLDCSNAVTVAMAQGGDFIGGTNAFVWKHRISRKAMNSFFCRTDRPFKFLGLTNEDVNAYCLLGSQGNLFFTVSYASIQQEETQKAAGGLTDIYLQDGTYVKSFYTVMIMPSAVKVHRMGVNNARMHHRVNWELCVPKILNECYKKRSEMNGK